MKIRPATEGDVDVIVEMSAKFYETTSYRHFTAMSSDTVANLARMLIDTGVMLVAEEDDEVIGMAGLYVGPFMFNDSARGAYEVVWWVSPDSRSAGAGKALMAGIEAACREKGCATIQMITLSTSPPHAGKVYESLGYQHSESSFLKVL